jgi:hypothetical protein
MMKLSTAKCFYVFYAFRRRDRFRRAFSPSSIAIKCNTRQSTPSPTRSNESIDSRECTSGVSYPSHLSVHLLSVSSLNAG